MDTQEYTATAASVPAARDFVARHFAGHPDFEDARLLASELAQNAVRHGDGDSFTVTVDHRKDMIVVAVANTGDAARLPTEVDTTFADLDAESGRGLGLVALLAPALGCAINGSRITISIGFPTSAMLPLAA